MFRDFFLDYKMCVGKFRQILKNEKLTKWKAGIH